MQDVAVASYSGGSGDRFSHAKRCWSWILRMKTTTGRDLWKGNPATSLILEACPLSREEGECFLVFLGRFFDDGWGEMRCRRSFIPI